MKVRNIFNAVLSSATTLFLVPVGFWLGNTFNNTGGVIPKFLFHFPDAPLDHSQFWWVVKVFIVVIASIYFAIAATAGPNLYNNVRRTVLDIYGLTAGFAITSLGIFLLTELPFDPEFFASVYLGSLVLVITVHSLASTVGFPDQQSWRSPLLIPYHCLLNLKSRAGLVVAISIAVPVSAAALFVADRDFANAVTRLRISLGSNTQLAWKYTDLFPNLRFQQPMLGRYSANGDFYILERAGRIYKVAAPDFETKELMLDFSQNVNIVEKENGAQGFDFHPEFDSENMSLFIYYTDTSNPNQQVNKLSNFDLSETTLDARLDSENILIAQKRSNDGFHNGGSVEFGPDGFLYVALGEMSAARDHQTIDRNLAGGIIRIDPIKLGGTISRPIKKQPLNGATQGYYIPLDNPFADSDGVLAEFWALGLRNPFRISFDLETKMLWAGEVGSTTWEEVNIIEPGANYQFPYVEGRTASEGHSRPANLVGDEMGPYFVYKHTAFDRAVIGGTVYRGSKHTDLKGRYVFADNYSGKIWAISASGIAKDDPILLGQSSQVAQRGISSLRQTQSGDIIITTLGHSTRETGRILRLVSLEEWQASSLSEPEEEEEKQISLGEMTRLYGENCARCHGDSGAGDGPDSTEIDVPVPNWRDPTFHANRTNSDIREFILRGGEALGRSYWMPPWEGILTNAEMDGLVDYIRRFDPEYNPPPGEPGHRH